MCWFQGMETTEDSNFEPNSGVSSVGMNFTLWKCQQGTQADAGLFQRHVGASVWCLCSFAKAAKETEIRSQHRNREGLSQRTGLPSSYVPIPDHSRILSVLWFSSIPVCMNTTFPSAVPHRQTPRSVPFLAVANSASVNTSSPAY